MDKHFRVHYRHVADDETLGPVRTYNCMAPNKAVADSKCTFEFKDVRVTSVIERSRFKDAQAIQGGACNPIAIANSLVEAIAQCRAENMDTDAINSDPAVQLIVHQLAHLTGTQYWEQAQYERAVAALTEKLA